MSYRESLESLVPNNSIIMMESALSYYRLCTFANQYLVIKNNNIPRRTRTTTIQMIPTSFGDEDITDYKPSIGRLKITTPERTICEMIALDGRDDFIVEALQRYVIYKYDQSYDYDRLVGVAKKYGVYEKLQQYLEWAYEDIEEI